MASAKQGIPGPARTHTPPRRPPRAQAPRHPSIQKNTQRHSPTTQNNPAGSIPGCPPLIPYAVAHSYATPPAEIFSIKYNFFLLQLKSCGGASGPERHNGQPHPASLCLISTLTPYPITGIVAFSLFLCSLSLSLQRHDLHNYRPFVLGYSSTFPLFNITNLCGM